MQSYHGHSIGLPSRISDIIYNLRERLPSKATISLYVRKITGDELGLAEHRTIYVSDENGLSQTHLYEDDCHYTIVIGGKLPPDAKEHAIGYYDSGRKILAVPDRTYEPFSDYPWLVEGKI